MLYANLMSQFVRDLLRMRAAQRATSTECRANIPQNGAGGVNDFSNTL
jgi:hypothetical protein